MTAAGRPTRRRSVPFADLPLPQLRQSHVQSWVKAMRPGSPRTRSTPGSSSCALSSRPQWPTGDRQRPSRGVALPRRRKQEAAMRIPTVDQVGRLLDGARGHGSGPTSLSARSPASGSVKRSASSVGDIDFLRRSSRSTDRCSAAAAVAVDPPKYGSRAGRLPSRRTAADACEHVERHAPGDADGGCSPRYGKPVARQPRDVPVAQGRKAAAAERVRSTTCGTSSPRA